jgi:hypothetical protein
LLFHNNVEVAESKFNTIMTTNFERFSTNYNSAKKIAFIIAGLSLLLAPTLSFTGWAIAHDSLAGFFNFNLSWAPTDATVELDKSDTTQVFRYYLLPHYFIYASMPVYIGLALGLGYMLFKRTPWHALIGVTISIIGAVYFVGVLGAFLSIPMGTVTMTNILKVSFALCTLVFVGNIIQGFGLYQSKIISNWASWCFILGNVLVLIFPGTENWMAVGSLLMVIGLFPLSLKIFLNY